MESTQRKIKAYTNLVDNKSNLHREFYENIQVKMDRSFVSKTSSTSMGGVSRTGPATQTAAISGKRLLLRKTKHYGDSYHHHR